MLSEYFRKNRHIVNKLGMNNEDIELILNICLYRGKYLVVGSVASPRIANMVMYVFDIKLKEILDNAGRYNYTRYADDIVISADNFIDSKIINTVEDLMVNYGFAMNRRKTYFMNKKCKRQITGVVIDNNLNKLTIGNRKYKEFERVMYNYLIKNKGDDGYIKGYLSYIKEVNIEQYRQIEQIYKKYDKQGKVFEA
jgi:hypothetical protein